MVLDIVYNCYDYYDNLMWVILWYLEYCMFNVRLSDNEGNSRKGFG